jgi:hypothetical protein
MISRSFGIASLVFLVIALLLLGGHVYFVFQAGCAGDLKGGSGDVMEAIRLEGLAWQYAAASILSGSFAAGFAPAPTLGTRVTRSVAVIVFGTIVLWITGFFLGVEAVQRCAAA